ncbi:hypothetical protein [Pseudoalteromonas sp. MMG005]|uniref:hypothetical protein n=1 Tax=Pseudoalteromonas sp. MMG005 TaxID=2822682 RepID=UPI001B3A62F4|nr:hypothetical protein [Pseudoalteromonas sp. MMG005]MBQ4844886.1 hypothetical protein [Pseudoalteromonas sp. MMG005]
MTAVEQFQESVFKATNIKNVIWIDDFFKEGGQQSQSLERLQEQINVLRENNDTDQLEKFPELEHIDFSAPLPVIKNQLPTDTTVIESILSKLDGTQDDLNKESFESFCQLFEKHFNFEAMSLTSWNKRKDKLIESKNTLFFVDLDFSKDGGAQDEGKYIIEFLLKNKSESQYCVLFTHNCLHGSAEEEQRLEVISQLPDNITHHTFSVLSKSIFNDEGGGSGIGFKAPELLKRAFIRKLCCELASSISNEMKKCIDEINNQLNQHSVYELDGSIFHRTLKEGASEFEVLHRLFSLKQSSAVHEIVKSSPDTIDALRRLRGIQKIEFKPKNAEEREPYKYFKQNYKPGELFLKLREGEIWTDATSLNRIHSPLRCGDTFEVYSEDKNKSYVLLEQSCDLIVRDNGNRKLNEALLVPFDVVNVDNKDKLDYEEHRSLTEVNSLSKFYTISTRRIDGCVVIFDFSKSFNVNLNLLDICVFNDQGEAIFEAEKEECPNLIFLPGWMEKYSVLFDKLVDKTNHNFQIRSLDSICKTLINVTMDNRQGISMRVAEGNQTLSMNIRRRNRLNSPFVDVLLRKLYAHKTRLPLDHDFSDFSWD